MNILDDFDLSGVRILVLTKLYNDKYLDEKIGKFIDSFPIIVKQDADVFTEEGKILLRFRKNMIATKLINDAYAALGKHLDCLSDARTDSSGGKNINAKSNIIGFFDKHSISLVAKARREKTTLPDCKKPRLTAFSRDKPTNYAKTFPFIEAVDKCYKLLCPTEYGKQLEVANFCAPYRITDTSFTTITINKNYRTALHRDKGDYENGFGNLTVFEKGKYDGGFTGFPQYGVAVDCRSGDFLAMDVHQPHANTPIVPLSDDYERISFVCYLREGIYNKLKKYGH